MSLGELSENTEQGPGQKTGTGIYRTKGIPEHTDIGTGILNSRKNKRTGVLSR